jgi:hypothetical protein
MSLTIEEMNAQVEKIATLRVQEADAAKIKKEVMDALELAESTMMEMLTQENMKSYDSPMGKVTLAYRTSVKTPKTPEDKEAFFAYLKNRNLYDSMISVNSQTLNSLYKAELEEATERGDMDFAIPGIKEVTINQQLRFSGK